MPGTIGAVILSAGASSRMGRPKALLPFPAGKGGDTFLSAIAHLAIDAGAHVVVAIGPPDGAVIRQRHEGLLPELRWAWNERPDRGMLSSVQAAIALLPPMVMGALVWPVDVPSVQPATVKLLVQQGGDRLVLPVYGGRGGHPIWVPSRLFPELLSLPPQVGLRQLRIDHPEALLRLPVEDPGVVRDIDTPADLDSAFPCQPG